MSPALRAPLLWLLLPFMGGLCVADAREGSAVPIAAPWIWLAAVLAAALGGWAVLGRERRGGEPAWAAAMMLLAGVAGYLWLPLRAPAGDGWELPPREVEVVLEIEQLFPATPQRKTFSGLARIVSAEGAAAAKLTGQRVYFSAIRRVSVVPEISGRYRYTGLVGDVPRATDARGFDRYLDGLGVRLRLSRGHLSEQTAPPNAFRRLCDRLQNRLQRTLELGLGEHPTLASVYAAMLLGERALLSDEQENAFMRSGVFHIFSISGLHVGVIAGAILSGLKLLRVPGRAARLAGLVVLWLYVQITGASVPAERAFLMIAFVVAGKVFRLPGNPLAGLAGAALTTLLLDPRQLFSTGFQMSYSVVMALVVMGSPLAERARAAWRPWRDLPEANWRRWQHVAHDAGRATIFAALITWSATLASTPSSIANFGLFSPGALVANLIVIPLSSVALVAGFLSLLAGLVGLAPVCVLMNHAAALAILAMDFIVRRGTELPGVYFAAEFRAPWMGSAALAVVLGSMFLAADRRWARHALWWLPPAALAATMILGVKFP